MNTNNIYIARFAKLLLFGFCICGKFFEFFPGMLPILSLQGLPIGFKCVPLSVCVCVVCTQQSQHVGMQDVCQHVQRNILSPDSSDNRQPRLDAEGKGSKGC